MWSCGGIQRKAVFFFGASVAGTAGAQIQTTGYAPAPNRLLVRARGTEESVPFALAVSGASFREGGPVSVAEELGDGQVVVMRYSTDVDPRAAAQALRRDPRVAWAQPDYLIRHCLVTDPAASARPDLFETRGLGLLGLFDLPLATPPAPVSHPVPDPMIDSLSTLSDIHAQDAWATTRGSRDVVVAVIDSGIDYQHEDLMGNLTNDVGYDFIENDYLPYDHHRHGTHVSGIIGAVGGNGIGISGVSPVVSLMALRALTDKGEGRTSDAIRAIDYAIDHGARLINASWGGPADDLNPALDEAIQRAGSHEILVVAAAGNEAVDIGQRPFYPAAFDRPNLLSVASVSSAGELSRFSNRGRQVQVAAPGENILSTIPNSKYARLNGTSMAAPHVTGIAALLLARNPGLKAADLKRILMQSVTTRANLSGAVATGGVVDALRALQMAGGH
jgi:serine protease